MLDIKKEIINVLNNKEEFNMENIIMKENNKNGKDNEGLKKDKTKLATAIVQMKKNKRKNR